jgi:uncharacterized membrane protein HdeD (DUF308 family)
MSRRQPRKSLASWLHGCRLWVSRGFGCNGEDAVSVILAKNWWSLVLRGLAAISLGLLTVAWHGFKDGEMVLLFGGYAVLDGLVGLAGAIRAAQANEQWAVLVIEGLAGIGAGIFTFAWPAMTLFTLVYVIAGWALLTGLLEILAGLRLRSYISGEWFLIFSGIASLVLGILMVTLPLAGTLTIALGLGAYALVFGILLIRLGFQLRSWVKGPAGEATPIR